MSSTLHTLPIKDSSNEYVSSVKSNPHSLTHTLLLKVQCVYQRKILEYDKKYLPQIIANIITIAKKFFKYLFIYFGCTGSQLWHVGFLVVACELLVAACMRDLVPRLGIELGPLALEARSLTHWTTREVPQQPKLIDHLLYARYCSKYFILNPHYNAEIDSIVLPILQIEKPPL